MLTCAFLSSPHPWSAHFDMAYTLHTKQLPLFPLSSVTKQCDTHTHSHTVGHSQSFHYLLSTSRLHKHPYLQRGLARKLQKTNLIKKNAGIRCLLPSNVCSYQGCSLYYVLLFLFLPIRCAFDSIKSLNLLVPQEVNLKVVPIHVQHLLVC